MYEQIKKGASLYKMVFEPLILRYSLFVFEFYEYYYSVITGRWYSFCIGQLNLVETTLS